MMTRAATPSGRLGRFEVKFDEAQVAIAPGQAVVLYDGDEPDWVVGAAGSSPLVSVLMVRRALIVR